MARPQTLHALTSLRFFAALWIVLYHGRVFEGSALGRIVQLGYIAVPFFFLLSGFILGRVYLTEGGDIDRGRFWLSRFARVYPLYVVSLFLDLPHFFHVEFALRHSGGLSTAGPLLGSLTLLQAWHPGFGGLNQPSWSLSAEGFFYAIFPFVGPFIRSLTRKLLAIGILLIFVAGMILVSITSPPNIETYNPLLHLPMFLLGIALSRTEAYITANSVWRNGFERYSTLLFCLCVSLLLASAFSSGHKALLQHGLLAPLYAMMILACTVRSSASKALSFAPLVLLGEASYALYLLHVPIKTMMRGPLERHHVAAFPLYMMFVMTLSVLSLRYLEAPARAKLLRLGARKPKETLLSSSLAQ